MKKRPFLLLEILIAFFLISLCIVPLVKKPLVLYRSELKQLQELEKERLADWTFSEVKEMLLKNEIPWAKIPNRNETTDPFRLANGMIELPGCKAKTIQRTFTLHGNGKKAGKDGADYRQLGIYVKLDESEYEFRLPVKRIFQG